MVKDTGYILYEGPGNYDGRPIVVIATTESANPKTGNMWQTWIMRQDIAPNQAVKSGDDYSVCGNCPLRPLLWRDNGLEKPCYVRTFQAPLSVWKKYKRNGYPYPKIDFITQTGLSEIRRLLQGKGIRLGSYGDPSTVPFNVWESIGVGSNEFTHTAYTHGYLVPGFDERNLTIAMVSLDPITESMPVGLTGRSFRVINDTSQLRKGEILCPASKEQDYKTTCAKCGLCAGLGRSAKNIAIVTH